MTDDKDPADMLIMTAIILIIILCVQKADAYTISKNRIIQAGPNTNLTLNMAAVMARTNILMPNITSLTIGRDKIELIRNCRSMEGSSAYQSGYMDACDWLRDLLGLKTSQYRSRPSFTMEGKAPLGGQLSITFPIWTDGTFRMNLSKYKYEFYRNNSEVFAQTRFTFNCSNNTDTNKTNIFGMSVQEMFKTNKTPDELRIYQK